MPESDISGSGGSDGEKMDMDFGGEMANFGVNMTEGNFGGMTGGETDCTAMDGINHTNAGDERVIRSP